MKRLLIILALLLLTIGTAAQEPYEGETLFLTYPSDWLIDASGDTVSLANTRTALDAAHPDVMQDGDVLVFLSRQPYQDSPTALELVETFTEDWMPSPVATVIEEPAPFDHILMDAASVMYIDPSTDLLIITLKREESLLVMQALTRPGDLEAHRETLYALARSVRLPHRGVAIHYADVLVTAYGGELCGAVLYRLDTDTDNLTGLWAEPHHNTTGEETAVFISNRVYELRDAGFDGDDGSVESMEYEVSGKRPNGELYTGSLSVFKMGKNFRFQWKINSDTSGDIIGVAYGSEGCGLVLYELPANGALVAS
jgi:hypothetical protein